MYKRQYITNTALYPLMGIEVGTTVHFPMTTQELQAALAKIGIDGKRYSEVFFTSFDSEEQASKAVEALEDYVAGQITANEDYRPAEIPKLENALVKQLQHTVLLLVANDYEAAAIDAYHSKS